MEQVDQIMAHGYHVAKQQYDKHKSTQRFIDDINITDQRYHVAVMTFLKQNQHVVQRI